MQTYVEGGGRISRGGGDSIQLVCECVEHCFAVCFSPFVQPTSAASVCVPLCQVEYIEDEPQDPDERNASGTPYRDLVRQARALATFFTERLPRPALTALHHHFGELPQDDDNLAFW